MWFALSLLVIFATCHQWNCINEKLNLTDALPPKQTYSATLRGLLPPEWQELGMSGVDYCYGNRTKKYTNTCPGQALMHCVVDYLVEYFSSKCCELPDLIKSEQVEECGFKTFMHNHYHNKQTDQPFRYSFPRVLQTKKSDETDRDKLQIIMNVPTTTNLEDSSDEEWDPLECCDVNGFIEDSWRSQCHFEMSWNVTNRLRFIDVSSNIPTTTTQRPTVVRSDVKVVPFSCEKETCIFKKLNVISDTGKIDAIAFTKLLDNMTATHPEWEKAKARVVTQCFSKIYRRYDSECRLNEVLGCVFDVLSENCPHSKKDDPCKIKNNNDKDIICQISAAKYAPKFRRQFCGIPEIVNSKILAECDVTSISTLEYVPQFEKTVSQHWENKLNCKELTQPTSCLLDKMGVLNKYGFVDYFKMKDLLRKVSKSPLYELYFTVFLTTPMYHDYCSSPRKLLNILDLMVMTCPVAKRKNNAKCKKIFHEIETTIPPNMTKEQLARIFKNLETTILSERSTPSTIYRPKLGTVPTRKSPSYSHTNKIYDYGILGSQNAPSVNIIDVKPKPKTLVILPVYQRMNTSYPIHSLQNDGIYRS
ncbi:unnamed protein product [Leptosia nina]|uniref:Uncharacterized protein n=1 Tax=Leptosia nina TaxID=320188 RepID=A0AAV1K116_9NEOP